MARPIVVGHRGAAAYAPENTLKSFEMAWKMGADMIELDIQSTADGRIVCIHDYELERTCGHTGLVHETDYDIIRTLDAGEGEHVPLLSEVLDFCKGKIGVNIEIKEPGVEEQALRLVQERDMLDAVLFSSFLHGTLQNLRELDTDAKTGVLYSEPPDDPVKHALSLDANAINPLFFTIVPELVESAHSAGLKVYPWTVNDEDMMLELLKIGVDGIISDMPDLAVRVVKDYSGE